MLELVTYNLGSKNQFRQIVKSRKSKPVSQTQDLSPLQCQLPFIDGAVCLLGEPASSFKDNVTHEPAG